MNIKEILKANRITQEEFADYLGMTRGGLNLKINRDKPSQSIINNLKFLVAEKRGIKIAVNLETKESNKIQ